MKLHFEEICHAASKKSTATLKGESDYAGTARPYTLANRTRHSYDVLDCFVHA